MDNQFFLFVSIIEFVLFVLLLFIHIKHDRQVESKRQREFDFLRQRKNLRVSDDDSFLPYKPSKKLWKRLQIPVEKKEIHIPTGLVYCAGDEMLYQEMLGAFIHNERKEDLDVCFKQGEMRDYEAHLHELKTASLSIGAMELSKLAGQLEKDVKEKKYQKLEENHADMLRKYGNLIGDLKTALEGEGTEDSIKEATDAGVLDMPHVLVIHDIAADRKKICNILESQFYVSEAATSVEAMLRMRQHKPNLILLSMVLGQENGLKILRDFKENEEFREIPVIFMLDKGDVSLEAEGFQIGAMDFIFRPYAPEIILHRINRILELDRLRKHLQVEVKKQTEKAEKRREKIEKLTHEIMQSLANTIDAKDKYTNGHSQRVAEYSREIAKRAGKSEQEQEDIYYMGLLHDIGKIGIPDDIINKSGGLTDEEFDIIQNHPVIGAEILKDIHEIPGIDTGARWHHEKYDGSGYPDHLKGEEIPEVARLIGVADTYDAMASKRSYRDVMPQEKVYEEIKKGIGTQFDPVFAKIMLEMMDEDIHYDMREK